MDSLTTYQYRVEAFKSYFFPWTITEWNSLDIKICSSAYTTFKKHLIYEFKSVPNSLFNIQNTIGIKLLTRVRLGFSHLNKNRYNHKSKNRVNPKCIFSSENESKFHFNLHCHFYTPIKNTLFYKFKKIVTNLQKISD